MLSAKSPHSPKRQGLGCLGGRGRSAASPGSRGELRCRLAWGSLGLFQACQRQERPPKAGTSFGEARTDPGQRHWSPRGGPLRAFAGADVGAAGVSMLRFLATLSLHLLPYQDASNCVPNLLPAATISWPGAGAGGPKALLSASHPQTH